MATFGKLASNNAGIKSLDGSLETTTPIRHIPVEEICPRFENKYIANSDKAKSLIESIRSAGLIEPINIISIEKYLAYRNFAPGQKNGNEEPELAYLQEMSQKGIKYFISSGHRRFKAYISITLGSEIITDDEWLNNYEALKSVCTAARESTLKAMFTGVEDGDIDEKWITIPAIVIQEDLEKESAFYNDSNTTQRELTGFEIIVNSIDEMIKNNDWNTMISAVVSERVDQMTDRKTRERVNDLVKANVVNKKYVGASVEEQKALLKSLDPTYIPGTESVINQKIVEYIKNKKQRSVSASNVNYTRKVLETFDKRLVQQIYDGKLTFKIAKTILPVYHEIDVENTIEQVSNGNFKIESVKKGRTKVQYTSRQLIDLIYDVRNGKKTLDEVIKLIEETENK